MNDEEPTTNDESEPTMRQSTYRPAVAPSTAKRSISKESRAQTSAPTPAASQRPATSEEAQRRFWARYGPHLLDSFFGEQITLPVTVDEWLTLATAVRAILKAREAASALIRPATKEGA